VLLENLKTALEALFGNRLRSLLTLSGVVIGVFAVTTTISLGQIATAGITGELQAFGAQSLFVSRVFDDPTSQRFTDDDIEALSRLPIEILRQRATNVWAVAGDERVRLSVNGTTANAPQIDRTIELARGRFFDERDAERGAPVIVLSADAAEALFEGVADPVGREVVLETPGGNRSFYTVIGVKKRISGALGAFANDVSGDVPLESLYRDVPGSARRYDFLPITIALDRDATAIEQQVRAILDRRRRPRATSCSRSRGRWGCSTRSP
jgi:putative ABC transport system permease protein